MTNLNHKAQRLAIYHKRTHDSIMHKNICVMQYVIFVPWVSTVHGVCTLSAVLCIPEGEARGNT